MKLYLFVLVVSLNEITAFLSNYMKFTIHSTLHSATEKNEGDMVCIYVELIQTLILFAQKKKNTDDRADWWYDQVIRFSGWSKSSGGFKKVRTKHKDVYSKRDDW